MSQENIAFQLDGAKRAASDAIAADLKQDRSYVINEAINLFLDLYQWHITEIQQSLAEAEAGDFAAPEEVRAVFARLTNAG